MALPNALAAQALADLDARFKAGTIDQAELQAELVDLFNEWAPSNAALANAVASLSAEITDVLNGLQVIGVRGVVATVNDLPGIHANGDAYLVTATGHAYAWLTSVGNWVDIGAFQGPEGLPGKSLIRTAGVPAATTGNDGDVAIDPTAGVLYVKLNGAWSVTSSMVGPPERRALPVPAGLQARPVHRARPGRKGPLERPAPPARRVTRATRGAPAPRAQQATGSPSEERSPRRLPCRPRATRPATAI